MGRKSASIGPIVRFGATVTEARSLAHASAARALTHLNSARPQLVHWGGSVSLVFFVFTHDGDIQWAYTNPRTVEELSADDGCERVGFAGYWTSASAARSSAINHMIQNDPRGIPEDLSGVPDLSPHDRQALNNLRDLRVACAV